MSLCADIEAIKVDIKRLGPNSSGINGMVIKKDETYTMKHEDRLELLIGQYIYVVEFEPPPLIERNEANQTERKRKCEEEDRMNKKTCNELMKEDAEVKENEDSLKENLQDKWEMIDNGKLLIFTAKNVISRPKVIVLC